MGKSTKMTKETARKIQSKADNSGKNQDFKAKAMKAVFDSPKIINDRIRDPDRFISKVVNSSIERGGRFSKKVIDRIIRKRTIFRRNIFENHKHFQ
ncbi:MAG: hypothetical protein GPJ51_11240 [Candidatus Heimdallarchaeota archaeon]|nr:hypothetical protein [Candidatus Heimdallarchaeota archaeon]